MSADPTVEQRSAEPADTLTEAIADADLARGIIDGDEASIAAWVAEQGIDRAEFEKAYRSFSVQLQTRRADEQSRKVRLPSVPTIVVDGRYLVPIKDDGDFRDQLSILNALIERARRERGAATPASH